MTDTSVASVSVIISTYNRAELLREAVKSALVALPEHGEIIVADDNSEPSAATVLSDINQSALRVIVNPGVRGAAANRNNAASHARSDLLLFLDDDDLMVPRYPADVVSFTTNHPEAVWGFSPVLQHTPEARHLPAAIPSAAAFQKLQNVRLKERLGGLGCGFWVRRSAFLSVGGIDERLSVNEDTDLCLKLLTQGHAPYKSCNAGVSLLRLPGITVNTPARERMQNFELILNLHADFLMRNPQDHQHILRRYLKFAAKAGQSLSGLRASTTVGPIRHRISNTLYLLGNMFFYRVLSRAPQPKVDL